MSKIIDMDTMKKSWCAIRLVMLIAFLAMALGLFCLPQVLAAAPQTLKVVMDGNYPPYVFRDDEGKLVGVLVDQWALWEQKTGIKVEISAMDWANALHQMRMGSYDVIDTIFRTSERERFFDFSRPYARLDVAIFFNKNISGINGIKSLKGFTVGVKHGDYAVEHLKQAGINNIIEYDSYQTMIVAAKGKNLLVFVMDKPPAMYYLYKYGLTDEIRFSQPLYSGEFHRAVRKNDLQTLQLVETGFAKISSAEYDSIDHKWFGSSPTLNQGDFWIQMAILGSVILISLLLMLWNWTLRRTVRRNTVALTVSEKKYRELLTNLSIGIIVHDGKGAPNFWNKAALSILGLSADQLTGEAAFPTGWEYISEQGERLTATSSPARIVIASGVPLLGRIIGIRKPLEKTRWFQVEAFPDFDAQGAIEQVVVTFFDITARRETEEKLLFISFHDALTGVHNRAYFEEELHRLDGRRSGAVTIAVADVDGMKQVNDTWGHSKGDEILMRVAAVLLWSVRLEDVVARIGGDEFAIILRDADEVTVETIFERMSQSLEIERVRSDTEIPLSVSFGYAFAEGPGMSAVTLFQIADNRMYQAKAKRTKNRL